MANSNASLLRRIRSTRHAPPGFASSDAERRHRYGAALEQFEELLGAARATGPAARPLPLFYAVAQAGVAIAAAHLLRDEGVLQRGHGLTLPYPGRLLDLVSIKPHGHGAFQDVAEATGSPALTQSVSIAALWASLPESSGDPLPNSEHPAALILDPEDRPEAGLSMLTLTDAAVGWIYPLPEAFGVAADRIAYLGDHLRNYPRAQGWEPATEHLPMRRLPHGGWTTRVQWRLPAATGSDSDRFEYLVTRIAQRHRERHYGWLRPNIGQPAGPPDLLMTWWALLYGLSMLARYHPSQWSAMLSVNDSPEATVLEAMLDDGLSVLPHLVLEALQPGTGVIASSPIQANPSHERRP